jgi:cGMP-dependent protein kinase
MGSLTELQTIKRSLEDQIKLLEQKLAEKDDLIQELMSRLDKYQSIVHSTTTSPTAPRKQRATGISAEPRAPRNLQDFDTDRDRFNVFPKSASSRDFIQRAIQADDFLKHLSPGNIFQIVDCMQLVDYKKETLIIKEGDVGSKLFVLEDGRLEVTKEGQKLCNMGPGKVFGELAILYNCTRTASVKALTPCKLWEIERHVFKGIIMRTELLRQQQCFELLKKVPRFNTKSDETINKFVDVFEEAHFEFNEYIVRQGASRDTFFIIAKGQAKETERRPGDSQDTDVRVLGPGDYFGDKALDEDDVTSCNVVVSDPCGVDCIVLDRETYTQLISKLEASEKASVRDEELNKKPPTETSVVGIETIQLVDLIQVATIGVGGFGRVELVKARNDNSRTYALKRMKKHHIVETRQQEHIMNEKKHYV